MGCSQPHGLKGAQSMDNKFLLLESAMNTVLNMNFPKKNRISEFDKLEEYARSLPHMEKEEGASLDALLKIFRKELEDENTNEECIGGYYRMLKATLDFNRNLKGRKCVVYGNNWLSKEIEKKMRAENICVFNWQKVNPAYLNDYDLHIVCDECLAEYELGRIEDKEKIVKLWDYLKYKFTVFPTVYKSYMNYKKKSNEKVTCIITGNSNIVNAVRSKQIHANNISLANKGQDIYYDYKMFCHACENLPDLRYAIIGLAPNALRYDASKSKVEWRRCLVYYPIIGSMHNCEDQEHLISIYESEDRKIKAHFDEEYIESLFEVFDAQREVEEKERIYAEEPVAREVDVREMSELYHRPYPDILEENKDLLERYALYCKEKDIIPIFFIPPYTRWYKRNMDSSYYSELLVLTEEICAKYDIQCVDMFALDLDDCYFKDYSNLNNMGAIKVASYINSILEAGQ